MHTERFKEYGFEPCEFEPDRCDHCSEVRPLWFGNRDFFEPRDGDYWCADCIQARIEADEEAVRAYEAMMGRDNA